jgi:hypothetical protein
MHRTLSSALLLILVLVTPAAAAGPLVSSLTSTSHTASTWSNDNTITVSWTNPGAHQDYGNVVGYSIAWNTTASYVPGTAISLDAAATSTTSNAVADGQNIYFHIRVMYDEYSPYQADTLGPFWVDTTAPSAVSSLAITRGDGQLTLSWTNPGDTDFAGVIIRRDTSTYPASASSGSAVTTMTASQSFTAGGSGTYVDTSLTNGTTYYYSVFAYDQRGGEGTRNYSTSTQANGSPTGSSSAPPQVSSNSPATSATGVAITSAISISFDKDMNSSTITTSTITVVDAQSNAVAGSISYATKTATFTPTSSLNYDTQYTVTVLSGSSGVKDSQGNGLDGDKDGTAEDAPTDNHGFSFTTAQATPPKVDSTTPANSATEVEPNSAIAVVFSKDMNASTITSSTITVAQGSTLSTTVSYNALDKTATITPASWLTGGSTVTVTVVGGSSGVKDENGLLLDSDGDGDVDGSDGNYTFGFTVKNTPIISLSSSTLAFGSTVSLDTKDLSVTVTNTGASALHMGTASIANTTYFTATADTCSGQTVAVSGTCSITVRFAPATTGALSTTLTIPSDSGRTDLQTSTNRTVTLSGTGVSASTASLSLSASSIEFGSVTVGQNSSTQIITVTSNGSGLALSIGTVSLQTGTNFAITERTCTNGSTVTVNSTCTITLRFSPASSGSKSDVLIISSNSGRTDTTTSTTSTVNLYGTASSQSASISLSTGWNLISIPYTPGSTAISTVLSGISGYYTIVWGYPSQAWKFYDPTDDEGSTLTTMEPGKGYWIKMTSARTLTASGTTPSTSVGLASGWNLVGYNRTTSGAASTVLSGISGSTTIVWGYPSQAWKFYDPTDDEGSTLTTFTGGLGYWIRTTGTATWTLP